MAEVPVSSSGDVREMTLGLYGFGAAGRYLHDIFHGGFGTKVIACDPYVTEDVKDGIRM